jgi:hypothetical protein
MPTRMDPSSLTNLCGFAADVGSRLVRLSTWVDGMPSAVKSLGFEIWATCEILYVNWCYILRNDGTDLDCSDASCL